MSCISQNKKNWKETLENAQYWLEITFKAGKEETGIKNTSWQLMQFNGWYIIQLSQIVLREMRGNY